MFTVGRVCIKIAGRDAGKFGVIVEVVDDTYVVVDGQTRRRKVNVNHLEPTSNILEITEKATTEDVVKALKTLDIEVIKGSPRKQKSQKTISEK